MKRGFKIMKKAQRLIAWGISLMILAIPASAAGTTDTAKQGSTMLNGDWKAVNGDWKYENGVFTATGGNSAPNVNKVGLQFTAVKNIRDIDIEYQVMATDLPSQNDALITFRTPENYWLGGQSMPNGGGYAITANNWGVCYMDMRNWATDTQYGQQIWGAHKDNYPDRKWVLDDKYHTVKVSTKGARVYLTVDDFERQSISVTGGGDTGIDNDYKSGCINIVFGCAGENGGAFVPSKVTQIKNLKMTLTDVNGKKYTYAYTEDGITRPAGTSTDPNPSSNTGTTSTGNTSSNAGNTNSKTSSLSGNNNSTPSTAASDPTASNTSSIEDTSNAETAVSSTDTGGTDESVGGSSSSVAAGGTQSKEKGNGGMIALIVVIIVVVLGGAAAGIFFYLKKKGSFNHGDKA